MRSDEAHNTTTQANRLKIDKKSKGGSPFLYLDTIYEQHRFTKKKLQTTQTRGLNVNQHKKNISLGVNCDKILGVKNFEF